MAAYPTLPQQIGSTEAWADDLVPDRSVSGGVKVRAFYTGVKRKFTVKHWLNATDLATLKTFYTTNRLLTFTFVWAGDGQTYTCVFGAPPTYSVATPLNTDVTVVILEQ